MPSAELAVVILAAGQGTRMKSALPKVLHPIAGRPMIGHVLAAIEPLKPALTVVVTSPGQDDVRSFVAPARIAIQDPPLGTGHAVLAAASEIEGFGGDILVLYGDTPLIRTETLAKMLEARRSASKKAPAPSVVVLGFRPDDPLEYGRLIVGQGGGLEAIVEFRDADAETRASNLCNSGVMVLDGAVALDLLRAIGNANAKREYYLTDVVALARARSLAAAFVEGDAEEVLGVNARTELAEAEAIVQRRLRRAAMEGGATLTDPASVFFCCDTVLGRDVSVGPNVVFGPGVTVADNAVIHGFCHIEGASIEAGAIVGPFARLRPGAKVGPAAHVGNFVEIKNAVIGDGAKANHLSYIGDAWVGPNANIGAGTITCNYDGYNKHLTVIGRDAFIGSNSTLVPPVTIEDGAFTGAGSVIWRDVEADAVAVTRAEQVNRAGAAKRFRQRKLAEKGKTAKPDPMRVARGKAKTDL